MSTTVKKSLSLQIRIFLSMIVLIVVASVLLAGISIIQFKNEAKEYHQERLDRKENAIAANINYVLINSDYELTTNHLPLIFKEKIYELSDIHKLEINLYDLEGHLIKSSKVGFAVDGVAPPIPKYILKLVQSSIEKRYVSIKTINGKKIRSSFSLIKNEKFKPIGILNLPYVEDDGYYNRELKSFLIRLAQVYGFMLLVAFAVAYFLSGYITKSLKTISDKLSETSLVKKNEKILVEANSKEINLLIKAYNAMVDELEESAQKLAQSEREEAWQEMAKQVAHEIKNPLTPMRLTVQSFQRKFDASDPNLPQKINDYSQTLIQQIDAMSSVATAFSNFATMPSQQNEILNVVQVIELALEIFNEPYLKFEPESPEIMASFDRTQLVRITNNLVKNAIQAIPVQQKEKSIIVAVKKSKNQVFISVSDNGSGIDIADRKHVFEPKFTTKSSGMGLGLGIIKNIIEGYKGSITFETQTGKGTTFIVKLPI